MNYIGDFAEDSTVRIVLTTNDGSGGAVAPSSAFEADDFRIYKNGSATQKTSTNGITCTSPFDSVTGLHILEIDTSNDTGDSGFWATGSDYWVVAVPDETVDSQTVVQVIGSFSIENRLRVKATDEVSANLTKVSGSAVSTSSAQIGVNVVNAAGTAWGSGAITAASIASNAITSAKIASGAITSTQIAADAIGASQIASNAITSAKIAADAIGATQIATGAITSAKFAASAITSTVIATDAIGSAQLASTAITEIQSGLATTANVAAVEADTQDIQSRLPANFAAMAITVGGAVTVGTNNDKTGYALTQAFPSNFAAFSLDGGGRVQLQPTQTGVTIPTVTTITNRVTANTDQINGVAVSTGTAQIGVNVVNAGGTAWGSGAITAGSIATGAITSAKFAAGAIDAAAMNVTGSEFTAIPWNPAWDTEVQSEVQDAIEANHLDHLLAVTYDPATKPGAADALLNELVESDGGVSRFTANALEQAPSGGGGGTDWTSDERTAIRSILGIPSSGTTPTDPTTGILDTVRDLVVTVDTVVDAIETDTQNIQSRLPAALVGGRIDANMGAISSDSIAADNAEAFFDGTGYAGTGNTIPSVTTVGSVSGAVGSVTGNVGGNVVGSVGSVTGAVGSVTAAVTVGTNNDKTNYGLAVGAITAAVIATDAIDADAIAASAVTEIQSGLATAAGVSAVETDTQDIQARLPAALVAGRIDASVGAMAANTMTASALATDAVTEIQSGLATSAALATVAGYIDTEVSAIKAVTDKLDTAVVLDGAVYQFTANALELAPSGGGGVADWTSDERTAIRAILGIPGSGTTPADPTTGILDTIRDLVVVVDTVADRIEVDTQDIQSRLPAALVSGRMDSSVGAMAANTITASALASDAVGEIADAVYDEAYAGHTTPGTYGFLWDQWRKSNPAVTGEVTSAVTPTTTQFSTDITGYADTAFDNAVLVFINGSTNADFRGIVSGYLQSNGVVTITPALPQAPVAGDEFTIAIPSFVYTLAQVQSGLATSAQAVSIKGVTDKLDTTVELDGAVYRFTTNALEQAPSGGGGGGSSIMVTPVVAQTPVRVIGSNIETFIGDLSDIQVGIFSGTDPVDLSGFGDLEVCVQERNGTDLDLVPMADLTISGDDNNYVSWTPAGESVDTVRLGKWSLRKSSNKQVIGYGAWKVVDAALGDGS